VLRGRAAPERSRGCRRLKQLLDLESSLPALAGLGIVILKTPFDIVASMGRRTREHGGSEAREGTRRNFVVEMVILVLAPPFPSCVLSFILASSVTRFLLAADRQHLVLSEISTSLRSRKPRQSAVI